MRKELRYLYTFTCALRPSSSSSGFATCRCTTYAVGTADDDANADDGDAATGDAEADPDSSNAAEAEEVSGPGWRTAARWQSSGVGKHCTARPPFLSTSLRNHGPSGDRLPVRLSARLRE